MTDPTPTIWPDGGSGHAPLDTGPKMWRLVPIDVDDARIAAVAELAALKSRRCDGCAHSRTDERYRLDIAPDYVLCSAPYAAEALGTRWERRPLLVRPDHHCAAWAPKEPQP
jgi:hypothetical protein